MVDPVSGPSRPNAVMPGAAAPRRDPVRTLPVTTASATLPQLVGLAADLIAQGPPVDFARIALIRQAIASGGYKPDPQAIANAILGGGGA